MDRRGEVAELEVPGAVNAVTSQQPNNPLHGVTLESVLERLVARHGWPGLAKRVDVNCFKNDPSIKSSLRFLRRTPWARARVEAFYLESFPR